MIELECFPKDMQIIVTAMAKYVEFLGAISVTKRNF